MKGSTGTHGIPTQGGTGKGRWHWVRSKAWSPWFCLMLRAQDIIRVVTTQRGLTLQRQKLHEAQVIQPEKYDVISKSS